MIKQIYLQIAILRKRIVNKQQTKGKITNKIVVKIKKLNNYFFIMITMNAIRLRDNVSVTVKKIQGLTWEDIDTYEIYILHDDIELIY